jgi:Ca2+-binding EF-hand superfamily protein
LINRVADKLKARGARGIIGLGRSFRVIDDNNTGTLDKNEFAKAMRDYRITDDNEEIEAIFLTFDADKTDSISYDEFLRAVVGEMNARR